jgi:methionyl-tRNA formyltransferase
MSANWPGFCHSMNIILVTHDSIFGRYLADSLKAATRIDKVIFEYGKPSGKFYWKKLKNVGPINFVFQYFLNRWFEKEGKKYLPDKDKPPHEEVENVNYYEFTDDDLILGFGSSFIHGKTLKRLKNGFLNLHTGILPQYRGVKSEFWVLYNRDYENAGWTLHFMVKKLDAGDVVLKNHTRVKEKNPAALRAKIIREAVPVIAEFLEYVRGNGFEWIRREPQQDGVYYTTPTLKEWREFKRKNK